MQNRLILYISIIALSFTLGYCTSSSEVQYIETVRTDTVWQRIETQLTPQPIPKPQIITLRDTVTYTYTDTVQVNKYLRLPYLISSLAPVTRIEFGSQIDWPTVTTERVRYIQPNGIYAGVSVARVPGASAAYLRGKWQFQYTYRMDKSHEIGVAYRVIGR